MDNNSKYFYCYSAKLRRFLTENGINWVDRGVNEKNGNRPYWMFARNERLENVINQYHSI